jgi:predicted permease
LINFIAVLLLCFRYLGFRQVKKIAATSVGITILGAAIDIFSYLVSIFTGSFIHDSIAQSYYSTHTNLNISVNYSANTTEIVAISIIFFVLSFVLLWTMYYFLLRLLFRIEDKEKSALSAVILALVTNPAWYMILININPSIASLISTF